MPLWKHRTLCELDHCRYRIAVVSQLLSTWQCFIANMVQRCLSVIGDTVSLKCQYSAILDVSLIVRFASDGNCASAWLTCKRWINCHRSRYRWFNIDLLLYNLNQPQLIVIALHTAMLILPMKTVIFIDISAINTWKIEFYLGIINVIILKIFVRRFI